MWDLALDIFSIGLLSLVLAGSRAPGGEGFLFWVRSNKSFKIRNIQHSQSQDWFQTVFETTTIGFYKVFKTPQDPGIPAPICLVLAGYDPPGGVSCFGGVSYTEVDVMII